MSYNCLCPCHIYALGLYEYVVDANKLEDAGQDSTEDTANFTSPSSGGSPVSIPVNQQQRVPNKTHAVPPAVTAKTYPKSSTAAPRLTFCHFLNTLSHVSSFLLLIWLI